MLSLLALFCLNWADYFLACLLDWLVGSLVAWLLAWLVVRLLTCSLACLLACLLFWFALLAYFDLLCLVDLRGSRG